MCHDLLVYEVGTSNGMVMQILFFLCLSFVIMGIYEMPIDCQHRHVGGLVVYCTVTMHSTLLLDLTHSCPLGSPLPALSPPGPTPA